MSVAAFIRECAALGLTLEQAARLAEMLSDVSVAMEPEPSSAALRQRRYRERKASEQDESVTRDVTRDVTGPSLSQAKERSLSRPLSKENSTLSHPPVSHSPSTPVASACPADPEGFERFWQAYPRKVGKLAARKAYAVAVRKVAGPDPPGLLIEAVERAKPFWTDPRFIPHPATWLNQGRWDDEIDTPKSWAELLEEDVA